MTLPAVSLVAHANEHRRPQGIMSDPTAASWLEALASVYSGIPDPDPELINGIITRSLIIDYALLGFVHSHPRVAVRDLGCGFSTRLYRLRPRVESWTHVDLPHVLLARAGMQRLGENEITLGRDLTELAGKTLVSADTAQQVLDHFMTNGLFILEGVLNHLSRDKAKELLATLAIRHRGSAVLATVMYESAVETAETALKALGCTGALWGVHDTAELETWLKPIRIDRTWLLGKIATRLGLSRPQSQDEASGLVFLAKL